jgi:hypothetical protein
VAYYSFVAFAKHPVGLVNPLVLIDAGVNTFTAEIDDLDGFLEILRDEGVEVRKTNRLDELESVPEDSMLLPGEDDIPSLPEP